MKNYFFTDTHLKLALVAVFLLGLCMSLANQLPAKANDKSGNYVKFTINAELTPPHKKLTHPAEYQRAPKEGVPGFMQLMQRSEDGKPVIEGEILSVVSFPQFEYRDGPYRPIRNWPVIAMPIIESITMDSWIEDRRGEDGILRATTFKMFEAVLHSSSAGSNNTVTIFATDYDYHPDEAKKKIKIDKKWIVLDMESATKLFNHVEAGSDVIIALSTLDSS